MVESIPTIDQTKSVAACVGTLLKVCEHHGMTLTTRGDGGIHLFILPASWNAEFTALVQDFIARKKQP